MDKLQILAQNFAEIVEDWPAAGLDEQEAYVAELNQLAMRVAEIRGVQATKLLHDVNYLRDRITKEIAPAQQRRLISWQSVEDDPATENPAAGPA